MGRQTDYEAKLFKVNPDLIVLDEFTSVLRPLRHLCINCKQEWSPQPRVVLKGASCKCRHPGRMTDEEYKKRLLTVGSGFVSTEAYDGIATPILHRHSCGLEWKVRPESLLRTNPRARCPECFPRKVKKTWSQTIDFEGITFSSAFEKDCYVLLSEKFGPSDITCQKLYLAHRRLTCDFYIASIDTYIEVSTIKKVWYLERIYQKRRLVDKFFFASSLLELSSFLE